MKQYQNQNVSDRPKEACCGCGGCKEICPVECISLEEDLEGFNYPKINHAACVSCGKCLAVCPMETHSTHAHKKCFSLVHKDPSILSRSASGGAFTALAQVWDNGDTIYYGCVINGGHVQHTRLVGSKNLGIFAGSKYVQSSLDSCYADIKADLDVGKRVFFSGTPCQVAGLNAFLGSEQPQLLTMDFVCHGVPSQKVFHKFLGDLAANRKKAITSYIFRHHKSFMHKVDPLAVKIQYSDGSQEERFSFVDEYMHSYFKGLMSRPACYSCPFARGERVSDFTVGDFWGIEEIDSKLNAAEGVSLVVFNTDKAIDLIPAVSELAVLEERKMADATSQNRQLSGPVRRPNSRDAFIKGVINGNFLDTANKMVPKTSPLVFLFGDLLSENTKEQLKKLLGRKV